PDKIFSRQLGLSIDTVGHRRIKFIIRLLCGSVEHIVRGNLYHPGAKTSRRDAEIARSQRIDPERIVLILLTRQNIRHTHAVDNNLRTVHFHKQPDRVPIRNIHIPDISRNQLYFLRFFQKPHKIAAHLSAGPGDPDPFSVFKHHLCHTTFQTIYLPAKKSASSGYAFQYSQLMLFYSDRGAKNAPAYFITIFSAFQFFFGKAGFWVTKRTKAVRVCNPASVPSS